jgi:hypothetical protein
VSKAIFGSLYETGNIDYREVLYHLLITLFLLKLSTNQQEMFASVMEFTLVLNEKATRQSLLNLAVPLSQTSPPSSTQDFRHRYIFDPQSVVSNLACPKINFIHDHGYVSVRECIGNLLAHDIQVNAFNSGMKLSCETVGDDVMVGSTAESLKMRNMLVRDHDNYPNHSVLCLPIYGWGDDYDPSASIKDGRASCHCKSVAIAPPHGKQNSLDNTCIVALSRKNKCHEYMEALL